MVATPRSLTPPLVLAAGAACLALIGLQLTADVETPSSDTERRELSTYAIDENGVVSCNWTSTLGPTEIPDSNYNNTIVVGYPGADKRVVLRQMEAMTELSGRDAWDFKYLGMTLQPFIKTNYPHHEGTWGWAEHGDQVVLVVRNIRKTIDEYHDILADIDYAKTWEEATDKIPNLYLGEVHDELYTSWRDERTMDEIGWYGWLIDYWMEGGILRDYFDHKLTTPEHWALLREPETYTYGELQWDVNNCANDELPPIAYDTVCDPAVTADCKAKVIISAERLMDAATGHEEHHKIGALLNETAGVQDVLIDEVAWDCLYDMLIGDNPNGTAPDEVGSFHDYRARGPVTKHVVSTRHLTKMIAQLTRLIAKYSAYDQETGTDWSASPQAQYLVELLSEHKIEIEAELAATPVEQNWAHAPKTNWVVFPKCGDESRRVWDYNYATGYSGLVKDMFPGSV
ncbi:hypothetical protein ACHAXR_006209 [Thalassiosira sp. AJA248-18]